MAFATCFLRARHFRNRTCSLIARARRDVLRREPQHRGQRCEADTVEERGKRLHQQCREHRQPKQSRIWQDAGEQSAQHPVGQRPRERALDMRPRMIDEVHVMHARGTRCHAREARQTTVDVGHDFLGSRSVVLQHLLDQIDATARRIELVAEQNIGRAGRGAEAAMHASAQDLVCFRDLRVSELRQAEVGLHRVPRSKAYRPAHIRPGLRTPRGSKLSLTRAVNAARGPRCGWNTGTSARMATGARTSMA